MAPTEAERKAATQAITETRTYELFVDDPKIASLFADTALIAAEAVRRSSDPEVEPNG